MVQKNIWTFLSSFCRCVKLLETLKKMILALSVNDPTNEELFANLEKIRAKFRQVTNFAVSVNCQNWHW